MYAIKLLIILLLVLSTPVMAAVVREFHLFNQQKNWTEAQRYCQENYIDLVTIEGKEDFSRIRQMVGNSGQAKAWIGLYDDVKSWRWSLDNTSLYDQDLGSWFPLPQDNIGGSEHCLYTREGKLHDSNCQIKIHTLCYDETKKSYHTDLSLRTWQEGQSFCRNTYTDLASIRNQQEWKDMLDILIPNYSCWVGLSREGWRWSDHSDSSFRGWGSSQPIGGISTCAASDVNGWNSVSCQEKLPFICSVIPRRMKVLKVTLKTDGSVNLNDPLVQEAALKQMEKDLRGRGVHQEFRLSWRMQPHGDVFNKTEL